MKRGFTITEMLVVLAITFSTLSVVGVFFADSWVGVNRAFHRADNQAVIPLVIKRWQQTLDHTSPSSWSVDHGVFHAGSFLIRQDKAYLVVATGVHESRLLLPPGSTCEFTIETPAGLAPCAVLHLSWDSYYLRKQRTHHLRFVACGKQGPR